MERLLELIMQITYGEENLMNNILQKIKDSVNGFLISMSGGPAKPAKKVKKSKKKKTTKKKKK